MITVFVDMDSVLADFMGTYHQLEHLVSGDKKFHALVKDHSIFEQLHPMPNADKLVNLLNKDLDVKPCILSSMGTWNKEISTMSRIQKCHWLDEKGIKWARQFVHYGLGKAKYAARGRVLIDDRADIIEAFEKAGGIGVEYVDSDWVNMEQKIRSAVVRAQQIQYIEGTELII
jgi:5'(3')-deoxyribonucleotidase